MNMTDYANQLKQLAEDYYNHRINHHDYRTNRALLINTLDKAYNSTHIPSLNREKDKSSIATLAPDTEQTSAADITIEMR